MALKDLVVERQDIHWPDNSTEVVCTVRGLSLTDVVSLMRNHMQEVQDTFAPGGDTDFVQLIARSPDFVSEMIALGTDEPESVESIRHLPMGLQLKILVAIWNATAISEEDLGNILAAILKGAGKLADVMGGGTSKGSVSERVSALKGSGLMPDHVVDPPKKKPVERNAPPPNVSGLMPGARLAGQ